MYRKIYQILEETGKVKTAMVLNGNHKGEKCLIKENHCLSFDENTADFWKKYEADLDGVPGDKSCSYGRCRFLCGNLCEKSAAYHFWRRTCSQLLQKSEKCWDFM